MYKIFLVLFCTDKVKGKPKEREFYVEKIPLDEEDDPAVGLEEPPQGAENILRVKDDLTPNPDKAEKEDGAFWERVRDNVQSKRPLEPTGQKPEGRSLKSLKVKKVTMSDSVDVYNDPQESCPEGAEGNKGDSSPAESQGAGPRVKAGKRCHNVVKVASAESGGPADCKTQ